MDKSALEKLEAKGVTAVLKEMASGGHGQPGSLLRGEVDDWIRLEQAKSKTDFSAKQDVREAETLAIAKEANRLAFEANSIARIEAAAASRSARWALYAAIIAAIMAIITAKDEILMLIFTPYRDRDTHH